MGEILMQARADKTKKEIEEAKKPVANSERLKVWGSFFFFIEKLQLMKTLLRGEIPFLEKGKNFIDNFVKIQTV